MPEVHNHEDERYQEHKHEHASLKQLGKIVCFLALFTSVQTSFLDCHFAKINGKRTTHPALTLKSGA